MVAYVGKIIPWILGAAGEGGVVDQIMVVRMLRILRFVRALRVVKQSLGAVATWGAGKGWESLNLEKMRQKEYPESFRKSWKSLFSKTGSAVLADLMNLKTQRLISVFTEVWHCLEVDSWIAHLLRCTSVTKESWGSAVGKIRKPVKFLNCKQTHKTCFFLDHCYFS